MSKSKPFELLRAGQFFAEGFTDRALEILSKFEKRDDLSLNDQTDCYLLKSEIFNFLFLYKNALDYAEKANQLSKETDNIFQMIKSQLLIAIAFVGNREIEKAQDYCVKSETLLSGGVIINLTEIKILKGYLHFAKGFIQQGRGNYDSAFEFFVKTLNSFKGLDDWLYTLYALLYIGEIYYRKMDLDKAKSSAEKCLNHQKTFRKRMWWPYFNLVGAIFSHTGELDSSIEFYKQGLKLNEEDGNEYGANVIRVNLGEIYLERGDFTKSRSAFEKTLAFAEKGDIEGMRFISLINLFNVTYEMKAYEEAQMYLNRAEDINKQADSRMYDHACRVAKAMILKIDRGSRKRVQAEDILNRVLNEEKTLPDAYELAFFHLSDLLLYEFELNGNSEILNELRDLISTVLEIAEKQHMFKLLSKGKIFRAKIALLTFDFEEARLLLSQAQNIADSHGLHLLARQISSEHDKLLNELKSWEKMKEIGVPLTERIKISRVNEQMGDMIQKRTINPPRLETEQSINISVFSKTGDLVFSYSFSTSPKFDEKIIRNFILISGQMAGVALDRLRFGENTVLLKDLDQFLICYVFKGQSYSAQQKLRYFSKSIQQNILILESLNLAIGTGTLLVLKDNPILLDLITESFTSDLHRIQKSLFDIKINEPKFPFPVDPKISDKYKLIYYDMLEKRAVLQKNQCRIGIAQMGLSDTGDIINDLYDVKPDGLLGLREEKIDHVRNITKKLIVDAHLKGINILLFPEMTVDLNNNQILNDIKDLAKEYEMYIIPGSYHDCSTKRNTCVVIGPEETIWEQEKHIPAIIHVNGKKIKENIEVGPLPRKTIVCNTEYGRIAIAICRDFLDMDLRASLRLILS
ncbi:MAG: hypothetical protein ACW97Z_13120 [Candidatus Hodarchaeales archaeon]|jgi:tetratricopeptide (TPR) repeat protein